MFPGGALGICVSHVGEHISLGICVSQVGEHMFAGSNNLKVAGDSAGYRRFFTTLYQVTQW